MQISNLTISCLYESIQSSGLPMRINADILNTKPNDVDLLRAIKLASSPSGAGHDNFLNGITVHFYLQCSNKMWTEMQRYHFIDFVSAQSTMHCMKKFNLSEQYNEYVDPRIVAIMRELQVIAQASGDDKDYLRLLYSNPSGFELGAYMVTNYRQLKTIYHQRKNHRLPEWREFCKWVEMLPYSVLITDAKPGEKENV